MNTEDDAEASSLQPVHKLSRPDPLHELQLLRDLAIINERTERELGPRPRQVAPVEPRRKPSFGRTVPPINEIEECNDMNPSRIAMVAALGVSSSQPALAIEDLVSSGGDIPGRVLSVVGKDRIIIAYQSVEATDGKGKTIALMARRKTKNSSPSDGLQDHEIGDSCEFMVMREDSSGLHVQGRSRGVVDCSINDEHRRAGYRELDESIELTSGALTYVVNGNTTRSGWWSYSFKFDGGVWYVSSAKNVYNASTSEDDHVVIRVEEVFYPKDIGFMTMEKIDTRRIADALANHVISED